MKEAENPTDNPSVEEVVEENLEAEAAETVVELKVDVGRESDFNTTTLYDSRKRFSTLRSPTVELTTKQFSNRASCFAGMILSLIVGFTLANVMLAIFEYNDVLLWELTIVLWGVLGFNVLIVLASMWLVFNTIRLECCKRDTQKEYDGINAIIPAYLPNEKDIVEENLLHLIHNVEFDKPMNIFLVYNTPEEESEVERKLQGYNGRIFGNKLVWVRKCTYSTSKAENINFAMTLLRQEKKLWELTYILDADHQPDNDCLMILCDRMQRYPEVDCVYGSTYIRNRDGVMGRLIDAEFWFMYSTLDLLQFLTGNAFFGGSNGLWKTRSLVKFDSNMLTEDIDASIRSLLTGKHIVASYRARSGELRPATWCAFFKQRTRWALGWDEVMYKHFPRACCTCKEGCRHFFGVIFLLIFRIITPFVAIVGPLPMVVDLTHLGALNITNLYVMYTFYIVTFFVLAPRFPHTVKKKSCCRIIDELFFELVFIAILPLWSLWQIFLELYSMVKIIFRKDVIWEVTKRKVASNKDGDTRFDVEAFMSKSRDRADFSQSISNQSVELGGC